MLLRGFYQGFVTAERHSALTLVVDSENSTVFVYLGVIGEGRVHPLIIFHRVKRCSFALLKHILGSLAFLLFLYYFFLDQLTLLHDALRCALLYALEGPFLELAVHQALLQITHLVLKALPEHLNFLPDFLDCSRSAWDFSETDTVWAFQLECLLYRFFLVFVHTETLPLCVNAVDGAAGEDATLDDKAPIGWVLSPATWIVLDDFKDFNYFAETKLGAREGQLLVGYCHCIL